MLTDGNEEDAKQFNNSNDSDKSTDSNPNADVVSGNHNEANEREAVEVLRTTVKVYQYKGRNKPEAKEVCRKTVIVSQYKGVNKPEAEEVRRKTVIICPYKETILSNKCDVCHNTFSSTEYPLGDRVKNLNAHNIGHTSEETFKCNVCGKTYGKKHHLQRHQQNHSGGRPFLCNMCNRTFVREDCFKIHMANIHHMQIYFLCSICSGGFESMYHLTQHMKFHEDEFNFLCRLCNTAFKRKVTLRRHINIHFKGQEP